MRAISIRKSRPSKISRRTSASNRLSLNLESLERRELLATGQFLQGIAYDGGGSPLNGATVNLYLINPDNSLTPEGSRVTGSDPSLPAGAYQFTGLAAGNYELVETAPTGYTNTGTQVHSQLNTASVVDTKTIKVTLPSSPLNATVLFNSTAYTNYQNLSFKFFGQTVSSSIGQFPVTANSNTFPTFCIDINNGFALGTNTYPVLPSTDLSALTSTALPSNAPAGSQLYNSGRIAYLFSKYDTTSLTKVQAAALQLAIWRLEYDNDASVPDFQHGLPTGNFTNVTAATGTSAADLTAVLTQAQAYWVESVNHKDLAMFLVVDGASSTGGKQGILATDSLSFMNTLLSSPSIVTSQQPASATVGTSIADKAIVSGGTNPSGTVTFRLYDNSAGTGTPLFVDTETLVGGVATSAGYTATATGTDYWVATYNGDSNNSSVISGLADEPVIVSPASPSIVTIQQPASATVGAQIADKAVVSGGYNPSGTVTFRLYSNPNGTGTPLFTDTESLVGGVATSAGYTATATGTDYWVATYNGDSNNSSVISGLADEPVIVSPASPSIVTVQQPATATVGSQIADTATISGGYNPSGTVTFRLYDNSAGTGTPLFTDTETLVGGVATSAGYTATATGTDYWVATYNGDSNNSSVISGLADEPVIVSPASPSIVTIQQPASTTVGSSIADKAIISGGFNPSGTVTFRLYDNSAGTGTPRFTDTETLVGGVATSAGYTATATGTDYWVATYNGDSNNASVTSGVADEPVIVSPASPSIATVQQPATITVGGSIADKAIISGGYNPSGTVTFRLYSNPNGTGTPLFTDTESLVGGVAISKGYTATATGTDYWVATYNGDSNNTSVTSGVADEPVIVSPATPSIVTIQQPASATVGSSIADKAIISGGFNPSGTVTFRLYSNPNATGTPLFTDTETLVGGVATSAGYTATATGTDYWVATYNGDSKNISVASGLADEPVVISPATPCIVTIQQPASATVGSLIADKAVISGGYNPGGTVTFKLYSNPNGTGTPLFTDTETLVGGVAISKGYTATAAATDYWLATYNGDSNNTGVTSPASSEPVTITKASPTIVTIQQPASATVGSSIADKAVISGGYNPSGTVTFSLYNNPNGTGTPLFTDTETLVGGVAISKGYTATATGTDYWLATYNGDSNNAGVFSPASSEPVVITALSPTITTTPGGTVALGSFTISGTKYLDTTGDGFSSADTPQAGVTMNLYYNTNNSTGLQAGDILVGSTTTTSNGTYSFTLTNPGTYFVQESVPSGYLQTGGGPGGSVGNTYYTVNATAGNNYTGNNFADFMTSCCNCDCSSFSFKVTAPNGSTQTVSDLSDNTVQGSTVSVTLPAGSTQQYTLVVYTAPSATFSDSNAYQQTIYQVATGTYASAPNHKLTVTIPKTYYQIDFVCGSAITQLEPNQNNNAYGPDSANILYHAQDRFISGDNGGTTAPSTMPTGTPVAPPTPQTPALPPVTLTDSATLAGGSTPTGTIIFYLFAPGVTPNGNYSNNVYTTTVPVNGTGTYTTAKGTSSTGSNIPTQAGTYQWVAVYSGDSKNGSVTSPYGSEPETVSKASPSVCTTPSISDSCGTTSTIIKDTAIISGGYAETGTLTFKLYDPKGNLVDTETVAVNGNGTYSTPTGYKLPSTACVTGTYQWNVTYSGDGNNVSVADLNNKGEQITIGSSCTGQVQGVSYWCGTQGQNLIKCLNGSSSCTNLGNWLASSCPNLFGNLKGCSNSYIASYCKTLSTGTTNQKACGQVLATALCAYVTDRDLAGTSGASYGFAITGNGFGSSSWNVGTNGSAIGLTNNRICNIIDLICQVDSQWQNGSFGTACSAVNSIFTGVNNQ
ncbi:beta strand repeat-containing protein [Singulisphaera rosea]